MLDGKAKTKPVVSKHDETVINDNKDSVSSTLIQELTQQVHELKEADLRSKADYQNLVRRTQEERSKLVKLASLGIVEDLLQPLDHLSMAAAQLKDSGLDMVVKQFWTVLNQHGLVETQVEGLPFDPHTMEVVDKQGDSDIVTGVVTRGYQLNGEVIRHAKVVVGGQTTSST